jgi:hypothetical protein
MGNDEADLGTKLIALKLRPFKFIRLSETPRWIIIWIIKVLLPNIYKELYDAEVKIFLIIWVQGTQNQLITNIQTVIVIY